MEIEREKEILKKNKQIVVLQSRLQAKFDQEKRQAQRIDQVKEEAQEVKEQKHVILDLK